MIEAKEEIKEVKISFNKQTHSKDGTSYTGCFTVSEELFGRFRTYVDKYLRKYKRRRTFSSEEMQEYTYLPGLEIEVDNFTRESCVFLKFTQTAKFIEFLQEEGIVFDIKRASKKRNYYLCIK